MDPSVAFGVALRRIRTAKRLSQEKLAIKSGLDRSYVSLLERGLRQPTLTTLLSLARQLGTTATALVRAAEEELYEASRD